MNNFNFSKGASGHLAFGMQALSAADRGEAAGVYFTMPGGPEGLLFAEINSLADAMKAGGLMLTDGTRYWFAAGSTMVDTIGRNALGKIAKVQPSTWTKVEAKRPTVQSTIWTYNLAGGAGTGSYAASTRKGYHFRVAFDVAEAEWFISNPVRAYALLTGASDGHGFGLIGENPAPINKSWVCGVISGPGAATLVDTPSFGYLATTVKARKSFAEIWQANKQAITAPAEAPSEYVNAAVSLWPAILAANPAKDIKPSIKTFTIWRNNKLFAQSYKAKLIISAEPGWEQWGADLAPQEPTANFPAPADYGSYISATDFPADRDQSIEVVNVPFAVCNGSKLPLLTNVYGGTANNLDMGYGVIEQLNLKDIATTHLLHAKIVAKVVPPVVGTAETAYSTIFGYVAGLPSAGVIEESNNDVSSNYANQAAQEAALTELYGKFAKKDLLLTSVLERGDLGLQTRVFAKALDDAVIDSVS